MYPNLSLALAWARTEDLKRFAEHQSHAAELPRRRSRLAELVSFRRYLGDAGEAHKQPSGGTSRRAGGARTGVARSRW
jgi:hypothetical protein